MTLKLGKIRSTGINCFLSSIINALLRTHLSSLLLLLLLSSFFIIIFILSFGILFSKSNQKVPRPRFRLTPAPPRRFPPCHQQQHRLETQLFILNPSSRHRGLRDIIRCYLLDRHSLRRTSTFFYLNSPLTPNAQSVSSIHQDNLLLHLSPTINPTNISRTHSQGNYHGFRTPPSRLCAGPRHLLASTSRR